MTLTYVAIATEKQLIGGYEDNTFRPDKPITRAEIATLLYRVIKSSAQDQTEGPKLEVNVSDSTTTGTFYISGKTNRDAKLSVNGKAIPVTNGEFKEGFKLDKEGTYDINIIAKMPSGKTTSVTKKITYQLNGPVLKIDDMPEQVSSETLKISGKVTDPSDSNPSVYLNDEKLNVSWDGSFSKEMKLLEGENTIKIKTKNSNDKTTEVTKKITFSVGGPELKIDTLSGTSSLDKITVSGTVTDKNDSNPVVYINDNKTNVNWNGSFSQVMNLVEGDNTISFKAVNKNGKTTTVTKKVTFNVGGPVLKINDVAETPTTKNITISGIVTDKNDSNPTVNINDDNVNVSWNGSFSKDYILNEGENTFTIKAKNSLGKTTQQTRKTTFNVGSPVLKFDDIPDNTTTKTITISGTATDKNDSNPTVYINDEKVNVSWNGSFFKDYTLNEGDNTFTVKAKNYNGKTTVLTKKITFGVGAPVIKLNFIQETPTQRTINVSGTVTDKNDNYPTVYVNDEKLYVSWNGSFNKDIELVKGVNTINISAYNSFGKSSSVTKNVYKN